MCRTLSPSHPCNVLVNSINKISALDFNWRNTQKFEQMARGEIRKRAFERMVAVWRVTLNPEQKTYTLPPLYADRDVKEKEMPRYTQLDIPTVTSKRSRLRADRAKLNASLHRLGYKGVTPFCDACKDAHETVEHVLAVCPLYSRPRKTLMFSLNRLKLSDEAKDYIKTTSIHRIVLAPEFITKVSPSNMKQLHKSTGKFILAVHKLRPSTF